MGPTSCSLGSLGGILSLWLAIARSHLSFSAPPSGFPPLVPIVLFPIRLSFSLLFSRLSSASSPFPASSPYTQGPPEFVLYISSSPSFPLPPPSFTAVLPSPTLPCLAKGQISRGNQQRQTRSSDFIIIVNLPLQFLPQGSKPARLELRTAVEAEATAGSAGLLCVTTIPPHSWWWCCPGPCLSV